MSKSKILTYLTGNMSSFYEQGRYAEATEWRKVAQEILKQCNIKVFDPTKNSNEHYNHPTHYSDGIILQNYTYLKKSDVLLVNLDLFEESLGSVWEVSIAWERHIPVIAFGRCDKWISRPHFKNLFTVDCRDVEEACEYIGSMYAEMI